ncbi:hypothetical protein JOE40_002110 [Arthrobacter sp. PvP102]|uniref:hypothetical protein n=1 Tax=unclassified Arthrobacter TaxID=235627 RepID=UPI001AEA6207|nr:MULTISPECIES: hypothetical protein [unclassified Arthrobacter]MBP1232466.1 hypothetical protein [Arthrobacter sp. PvP103]MBP1237601.1 hypothetical protein [Arthrobacter sp. PvP102]
MNRKMRNLCLPAALSLALLSGVSAPAFAGSDGGGSAVGPWPPEDTDGKYVSVPDAYYADYEFEACDTTIKVSAGDEREVTYKGEKKDDGTLVIKYRGDATIDLTRASDGATIDELDVSGPFTMRLAEDGLSAHLSGRGPALIYAMGAAEEKAFEDEGLPKAFYFTEGRLAGNVAYASTDQKEVVSGEITHNSVRHAKDICKMLDRAKDDDHGHR